MLKISVVIPTYNNGKVLPHFFDVLKKQTYKNVEYVVSDGGSTDNTLDIAKKNGARIVKNVKKMAEPGVRVGMKNARGDLLTVMAIDNFFYNKNAFKKIAKVFDNRNIVAAFPKQDSLSEDNLFTKYRNTFSDPISHFIYGYATNGRTFKKYYDIKHKGNNYEVFDYGSKDVPPLIAFAQGFTIRKNYVDEQHVYDDIKPVIDLIESGKDVAYIYNVSLFHHTYSGMLDFIKKIRWPTRNLLEKKQMGINVRSENLPKIVKVKMYIWPFYSLSIILPAIRSVYGLLDERNPMWLFHPVISFVAGVASVQEVFSFLFSKINK